MSERRIVTITLNPAVDRVLEAPNFAVGKHIRGKRVALYPAGKGINVSRVLATLDTRSVATGFVGKGELAMFEEHLEETGKNRIVCQLLIVPARTRDNVTIVDPINDTETHIRDEGFHVRPEDVARMASKLSLLANDNTTMAFAGSLPPGVSPSAFAHMIERCVEQGATVAVDTSAQGLTELRDQSIWLLKVNQEELAGMTDAPTDTQEHVIAAARSLSLNAGGAIHNTLATMGADGAVLIGDTVALRGCVGVHPGRIVSTVGCGDCMVAGVIAAFVRSGDWHIAMREGLAAATAGAIGRKAGFVTTEDIAEFREMAIIEPLEL